MMQHASDYPVGYTTYALVDALQQANNEPMPPANREIALQWERLRLNVAATRTRDEPAMVWMDEPSMFLPITASPSKHGVLLS